MPNVGAILKSEITRLSKKTVREQIGPIHTTTNIHRKQLAALKKQLLEVQRELAQLRRTAGSTQPPAETTDGKQHRFSAKGLATLRAKLGLSADAFGLLVGVTGHTIYSWEKERSAPRAAQASAVAALRGVGKREARRRLAALEDAAEK